MDIKDRVREAIRHKYLSIKDFCSENNVSYRTVQHYLSGRRMVSTDFLITLSEQIGVSSTWILTGLGDMVIEKREQIVHTDTNFITIPRWSAEASAGAGAEAEGESITGEYAFSQRWLTKRGLNPNALAVISVTGDSMEPDLYDGDLILIDHSETAIKDSKVYAIRFSDGLFVKRIQQKPNSRISLLSSNKFYDPIEIKYPAADSIQVVGRVVASMHEW